jgi:hypothetical protein
MRGFAFVPAGSGRDFVRPTRLDRASSATPEGINMMLVWSNGDFTEVVRSRPPKAGSRRKPLAVCMSCGNLEFRSEFAGSLCAVKLRGKRCRGFVASAPAVGTWERCPHCANAGSAKARRNCSHCSGSRWRCVAPAGQIKVVARAKATELQSTPTELGFAPAAVRSHAAFGRP